MPHMMDCTLPTSWDCCWHRKGKLAANCWACNE